MLNNSHDRTDTQLLIDFVAGSESAFVEIMNRYKDGLYSFLSRFLYDHALVEDVFQETFLQLFKSATSFDTSRNLRPWLFTIAANKAKDVLRKQKRQKTISIDSVSEQHQMSFEDMLSMLKSSDVTAYDELAQIELADQVKQVIANMPENLREILILMYFNRFSYKQIAEMLSIPIGTVKSRLHSAVGRFGKDFKAAHGDMK